MYLSKEGKGWGCRVWAGSNTRGMKRAKLRAARVRASVGLEGDSVLR